MKPITKTAVGFVPPSGGWEKFKVSGDSPIDPRFDYLYWEKGRWVEADCPSRHPRFEWGIRKPTNNETMRKSHEENKMNPNYAYVRPTDCHRADRIWIEDREDGTLVAYTDYKAAFEAGDGRAVPYLKMTAEIIEALTNAGILK